MTRHGNNATNSSVYSYSERKKDQKQAGYGTEKMRLGKDAIKGFDCCSLTLQPTSRPVISPQGYIFDKEAIFTFILEKKNTYNKQMKEYERQKEAEIKEFRDNAAQEEEDSKERFEQTEKNIVTKRVNAFKSSDTSTNISNMREDRKRVLPSFWLPSMAPQAKKTKLVKPDKTVYCPISRQPLRVKDLVTVIWTEVRDPDNKKSMIARDERYQCAVTGDTLYDSTHCAVLKPTGHVVTMECVEKIIKKDWQHPLTGQTLTEKDIMRIVRGATGFSAANDELLAERDRPTMAIA
jgi:nitric oxide synthase-interacting protein